MDLTPLQSSFSAGELSPLMRFRPDLEGYQNGAEEMLNMFPDPRGPAYSRVGMKHVLRSEGTFNDARVEVLQIAEDEFYAMLLTDLKLAITTPQGAVPGTNLIQNSTFEQGGASWTTRASTGSSVNYAPSNTTIAPYIPQDSTLTNPDFGLGSVGWTVRESHPQSTVTFAGGLCIMSPRTQVGNYAGIAQQASTGFPGVEHTLRIEIEPGSSPMALQIGVAEDDGTYLSEIVPSGGGPIEFAFTPAASPYWITLDCNSDGAGAEATISLMDVAEPQTGHTAGIAQGVTTTQVGELHPFTVSGEITPGQSYRLKIGTAEDDGTYVDVEVGIDDYSGNFTPTGATIWITIDATYPSVDPSMIVKGVLIAEPDPGGDDYVNFDTPYLESELHQIQFVPSPSGNEIYFLHRNHPTHKLTYDETTKAWGFVVVTFTAAPSEWTGDKHPSSGAIFQGRLWLGGPDETFWASVSGTFEDFTIDDPLDADSAFKITMEKYGAIRWIAGLKNLLIGTENGEHIVTSVGGVINGTDIQIEQQSSYGSALIQPLQVGDQIVYVSPDRRKVRAMQYEWTANNWLSRDMTFTSEHITEGLIKSMIWAQNPDNLLLFVLYNGDVVSLRYERGNNIYGWSRVQFQYDVKDLASGTYFGFNEVVSAYQLIPDKIDLGHYDITDDETFVDAWISVYNETATTTITGLDHLEGHVVQVVTDGAVHPERIVLNGVIELQWEANLVTVGLGFTARLKTLRMERGAPAGSAAPYRKRYYRPVVRVIDSERPLVNGVRAPDRTPSTPMGTKEPSRTEDIPTAQLGYDDVAQITVEQDLPLDLKVAAIFGELTQSKL